MLIGLGSLVVCMLLSTCISRYAAKEVSALRSLLPQSADLPYNKGSAIFEITSFSLHHHNRYKVLK